MSLPAVLLLSLIIATSNIAAEPYEFVALHVKSAVPKNLSKTLPQAIASAAGIEANVHPLDGRQAVNAFNRGLAISMENRKCSNREKVPVLRTRPYAILPQYLITNKNRMPINNIEQLRGLSIAFLSFQDYQLPSNKVLRHLDIKIHYTEHHSGLIKMLLTQRVDAILVSPHVLEVIVPDLFRREDFNFDPSKPFYLNPICYITQDNPLGKALVDKLNNGINILEKRGSLTKYNYFNLTPESQFPLSSSLKSSLIQDLGALEAKLAAH